MALEESHLENNYPELSELGLKRVWYNDDMVHLEGSFGVVTWDAVSTAFGKVYGKGEERWSGDYMGHEAEADGHFLQSQALPGGKNSSACSYIVGEKDNEAPVLGIRHHYDSIRNDGPKVWQEISIDPEQAGEACEFLDALLPKLPEYRELG